MLRALEVAAPDLSAGFGPDERLYFLHIHKTAGSTLARILETHFGQGQICPPQTWQQFLALPHSDLAQYRLFRGHLLAFSQWLPSRPWVVTFLRDPVERTLSTYDYIRRNDRHRLHRAAATMDLETFLHEPDTAGTVRDLQTRWILANAFPCDSLKDMERQLAELDLDPLETARRQLDTYAFVGLVERFEASVQRLMDTLGWPLFDWMTEHAGDRVNVSEGRVRRDELSPGVLDRILELTVLDRALHEGALAPVRLRLRHRVPGRPQPVLRRAHRRRRPRLLRPRARLRLADAREPPGHRGRLPLDRPPTGGHPLPPAPARRATSTLRLTVQKAITPEVLAGLRLRVDDQEVDLRAEGERESRRWLLAGCPPAPATTGEVARLRFSVESTTSPAALGRAPDRRQLGVAFSRLELRPAVLSLSALARSVGRAGGSPPGSR